MLCASVKQGSPLFVFSLVVGNPEEALKYLEDQKILSKDAAQDTLAALPITDMSLTISTHNLDPQAQDDILFVTTDSIRTNRSLVKGLAINVLVRVPKTCPSGSKENTGVMLCGYLQKWFGPEAFIMIVGAITFTQGSLMPSIVLNVSVANIKLTEEMNLTEGTLFISIGSENKLGVSAQLAMRFDERTTLQFKGELVMGFKAFMPYLSLDFTMIGIWKHPFGLKWISVGNAKLKAAISTTEVTITVGGSFYLGESCTVPTNLAISDVDAGTGLVAPEAEFSTNSQGCMSGSIDLSIDFQNQDNCWYACICE